MRMLFRMLIVIPACAILAIAGGLLVDNARGKQQWQAWKAQRIALGDRFEWSELAPPAIPDAENFAMAPLVAGAVLGRDMDPRFKALEPPKISDQDWGNWKTGRRINLAACAKAYKTKDLLKSLAPFADTLEELDSASRRPHSRIPVDYADLEIPGLLGFRGAVRTLRLRALVNLSQGHAEAALGDIRTCLRLADHFKAEPHLIASLLRTSILGLAMQPIWEGLIDHRWDESQLGVIQEELGRVDLMSSIRLGFEGERMNSVQTFTCMAEGIPMPTRLRDASQAQPAPRLGWLAKRWIYRNLLEIDRFEVAAFLDPINVAEHRVYPEKAVDPVKWLKARRFRKDLVIAQIAIPALMGQIERAARVQSGFDQARLVCSLERYRIHSGIYPESLSALSPVYLARIPFDLVNGQSLRYRSLGQGFRLYSQGWNGTDEDGKLIMTKDPKTALDLDQGDWPWMIEAQVQ